MKLKKEVKIGRGKFIGCYECNLPPVGTTVIFR